MTDPKHTFHSKKELFQQRKIVLEWPSQSSHLNHLWGKPEESRAQKMASQFKRSGMFLQEWGSQDKPRAKTLRANRPISKQTKGCNKIKGCFN